MWLLMILIMISVLVILVLGLRFVENLESENRAVEARLHAAREYDEAFAERMKEIQRFRHDINGLLQAIEHDSTVRDTDGDSSLAEGGQDPDWKSDTLVDSLVKLKQSQCSSANIAFSSDVDAGWQPFVQERGIEEADVQAVVQNLLQNAYEASLEVFPEPDRLIRFRMGIQSGKLHVEVTNRTASSKPPTFETTKPDPEQHGIGLRVVQDIASSYGGGKSASFDPQTRLLTVCVTLQGT